MVMKYHYLQYRRLATVPVDIDGNPKAATPADLTDANDPISPSPENGYHSNSSTIEDSDSDDKASFGDEEEEMEIEKLKEMNKKVKVDREDEEDCISIDKDYDEKDGLHHRRHHRHRHPHMHPAGAEGVINLEEYMNRSDTAIIYPEPVEDLDRMNGGISDDPDSPGNDNETENEGELGKPVDCPYCDRSYKRLTSLKEHIKYRHEKTFNNFSCPECNYCFAYKSQLERHMATHMPGRNQICDICNKAFVNIYRLQRHMLTHTSGNRKFKCGECGKAFKYKHHLKEHLRIHSGEKPYECPTCLKRFSHSGSYSSHISSKKCSPVKEQPTVLPGVPPVKVVGSLPLMPPSPPVLQSPISDVDNSKPSLPRLLTEPKTTEAAYMTPLHIKIPNADGSVQGLPSSEKQENGSTTPLTSPANDAVKKVLQIVASTVSKQQADGQKTDISKLKKTKTTIDTPPVVASPFEIRPFKLEKLTAVNTTPLPKPSPVPEKTSEEPEKPKLFVNGNGVHQDPKSYNIVDYTLKKVHEAQAINRCLQSRFPVPMNLNPDRTGCKYCGREFNSPIDLHQHERYLCDLNEDVLKMKLFQGSSSPPQQNMSNFKLDRYYQMQQQFLAEHEEKKSPHDEDNEEEEEEKEDDDTEMKMLSPNDSREHLSPQSSPRSRRSPSPCRSTASPDFEVRKSAITDMNEMLEAISKAQEQALRAFYAMQAKPSEDGIEKISVALNLPMQLVNKWFQRTRKLEEEGSDPSLKSLSLLRQSPVVTVVHPSNHRDDKAGAQSTDCDREAAFVKSKPQSYELDTASVGSSAEVVGDSDSAPASPCSSINSVITEPANNRQKSTRDMDVNIRVREERRLSSPREHYEPMDRESRSPVRSPVRSPMSSPLRLKGRERASSPLDLSMPKRKATPPPLPLHRSSMPPKLVYGFNYSALYSAAAAAAANGYLLPAAYAPPEPLSASLLEKSIKPHGSINTNSPSPRKATSPLSSMPPVASSASDASFLLKRSYPDPLYAYLPTMNGYGYPAKRMRFADGVEYPAALPPVNPHLQVPDVYSALAAKTGYMQSTMAHHLGASFGATNPFLPAMLNGASIHQQSHADNHSDTASQDSLSEIGSGRGRRRTSSDRPSRTSSGQYACSQCPKTFQKHSSLLRHVYEHSGKRPHQCKECGKAFKHKHHLMEHSRLHSGEKPYQCDRCLKKFSHSGSYSQHMNHRYSYCRRDAVGGGGVGGGSEKEMMVVDHHQGAPEEME